MDEEFAAVVGGLLKDRRVKRLDEFRHHFGTSRLRHCLGVAYVTYRSCRRAKLDWEKATVAALLHDLYYHDWRDGRSPFGAHLYEHPSIALANARTLVSLTAEQENAILSHMWPFSRVGPRTREAWAVCAADKICSICEICRVIIRCFCG